MGSHRLGRMWRGKEEGEYFVYFLTGQRCEGRKCSVLRGCGDGGCVSSYQYWQ